MAGQATGDPGVLGLAWKRYLYNLKTRPLKTKAMLPTLHATCTIRDALHELI